MIRSINVWSGSETDNKLIEIKVCRSGNGSVKTWKEWCWLPAAPVTRTLTGSLAIFARSVVWERKKMMITRWRGWEVINTVTEQMEFYLVRINRLVTSHLMTQLRGLWRCTFWASGLYLKPANISNWAGYVPVINHNFLLSGNNRFRSIWK